MRLTKAIYLLQQPGTREIGSRINSRAATKETATKSEGWVGGRDGGRKREGWREILANSSLALPTIHPRGASINGTGNYLLFK